MNNALRKMMTSAATVSLLTGAFAADYTWTGEGGDNLWSNAGNWGGGGYPQTVDDAASFPAGAAWSVDGAGGEFAVGNLTAGSGAEVTFKDITVNENANFKPDGATWILNGATLNSTGGNKRLAPASSGTSGYHVILENGAKLGMTMYNWNMRNGKVTVRDGDSTISGWTWSEWTSLSGAESFLFITNATFTVGGAISSFQSQNSFTLKVQDGAFVVNGALTFGSLSLIDLTLPADGTTVGTAPIRVNGAYSMNTGTKVKVDVSRCTFIGGTTVTYPLVAATSTSVAVEELTLEVVGAPAEVASSLVSDGKVISLKLVSTGPKPMYNVKFVDWDGSLLGEQSVGHFDSAVPPAEDPERGGHVFAGWVPNDLVIVSNTVFTALYVSTDGIEYGDVDAEAVTYTWKSKYAKGLWLVPEFWESDVTPCYGIPSNKTYATAHFASDATIDLGGNSYQVNKFTFANGAVVKLSNGTITHGATTFDAGHLELQDVDMTITTWPTFASGHTLVLSGSSSLNCYRVWNAVNGSLIVRDGESKITYVQGYCGSAEGKDNNLFLVTNAVLTISGNSDGSTAAGRPLVIRNGSDRQGRVILTSTSGASLSYYRYDFAIPKDGLLEPAIEFVTMAEFYSRIANTKSVPARVTVDVTQYERGKPVPLVRYGSTTRETLPEVELTTVPAEAKDKRHAQLYWADNTLWYKQEAKSGMLIMIR